LHLYQGSTHQFIADATQARLANEFSDRFFDEFRYEPEPSEVNFWRNSLGAMAHVLNIACATLDFVWSRTESSASSVRKAAESSTGYETRSGE
jgi:hypothetical protein